MLVIMIHLQFGQSAFCSACHQQHIVVMTILLQAGSDIRTKDTVSNYPKVQYLGIISLFFIFINTYVIYLYRWG